MNIKAELVKQKGNPQIPANKGDAIRTIVQFPMVKNLTELVEAVQDESFTVQIGDKSYSATAYREKENTQSIKISLPDSELSPPIITFIVDIYMPLTAIDSIINTEYVTIQIR